MTDVYSIQVNGIRELYVWVDIKCSNDWISFSENINLIDSQLMAYYYSKALNFLNIDLLEIVDDFDLNQYLFELFMLLVQNCNLNITKLMIQSLTDIYLHSPDANSSQQVISIYCELWKNNDELRKINFLEHFSIFDHFYSRQTLL